jgi:hypothetical protein
MGLKSRRKGKVFERKIARAFREKWPDALVRRASQAERAHNPDVFVEGGPPLLSSLWMEMHDAATPLVAKKLAQAERDSLERSSFAADSAHVPVVIWHKLGERSIQVTMRSWAFAWLAYDESHPDSQIIVTLDFASFMRLVETAAKRAA